MEAKEQLRDFEVLMVEGFKRSFKKMLEMKIQKNSLVIIYRNGQIIAVSAKELAAKLADEQSSEA